MRRKERKKKTSDDSYLAREQLMILLLHLSPRWPPRMYKFGKSKRILRKPLIIGAILSANGSFGRMGEHKKRLYRNDDEDPRGRGSERGQQVSVRL